MSYGISSMNKVILIGRLGSDTDLKYGANGTAQAKISLATSERWKDKDGNNQEKTEWHRIVAWGAQAEFAGEWLKKGQLVCIEGKLTTRSWEQDGEKKYMTEVTADQITMLSSKGENTDTPLNAPISKKESEEDDLPF